MGGLGYIWSYFYKENKVLKTVLLLIAGAVGLCMILIDSIIISVAGFSASMIVIVVTAVIFGALFLTFKSILKKKAGRMVDGYTTAMLQNCELYGFVKGSSKETYTYNSQEYMDFLRAVNDAMKNRNICKLDSIDISVDYVVAKHIDNKFSNPLAIPRSEIEASVFSTSNIANAKRQYNTLAIKLKDGRIIECIIKERLSKANAKKIKKAMIMDMDNFIIDKYLIAKRKFITSLAVVFLLPVVAYALRGISNHVSKIGARAEAEFVNSLEGNGEIVDFSRVSELDTKYIKNDGYYYSVYEKQCKNELCILKSKTVTLAESTNYYTSIIGEYGYVMNASDEFIDINDIYADWELVGFNRTNDRTNKYNYSPEDLKHIVVYDVDKDIRYTPEEFRSMFKGYYDNAHNILVARVLVLCPETPCIIVMLVYLVGFIIARSNYRKYTPTRTKSLYDEVILKR